MSNIFGRDGVLKTSAAQLFLVSASIMLLELICIRWIAANIRLFGFFINFVLLSSLLGIGIGILCQARASLRLPAFPTLLLTLVVGATYLRDYFRIPTTEMLFYGSEDAANSDSPLAFIAVIVTVTLVFIPLGWRLGRLLVSMPPLRAYGLDIAGSLTGIALFTGMSFLSQPPIVWFVVFALLSAPLLTRAELGPAIASFVAIIACVQWQAGNDVWSSYYHVVSERNSNGDGWSFGVNNIGHQSATHYAGRESFYFRPYDILGRDHPYKNVLIIGAGTGSDVALALANGAGHVTAVEIDRELYRLGRELHPDKPYDDPRVTVHINDGRAFLRHTDQRFDLIIFALTDSLTLTSGYANVRLETFLFTLQGIEDAKARLTDDGVVALYNYYREPWSISRLARILETAFGVPPFVTTYGQFGRAAAFLSGPGLARLDPALDHPYAEGIAPAPGRGRQLPVIGEGRLAGDATLISTDDWPFFYLKERGVPRLFLGALAIVGVLAVGLIAFVAPKGSLARFTPGFFFLGAAFMLLEARSLVTFALLFGTTWFVNALVFFAILTSVLLAVGLSSRVRLKRIWPLYVLLFALLAANWLVPTANLLAIGPDAIRYGLAALFAFAPVFVANVIFSQAFADTGEADVAFAYNLVGIMLGGMLEYAALAIGYQNLLLLVIAFYALAFLTGGRAGAKKALA